MRVDKRLMAMGRRFNNYFCSLAARASCHFPRRRIIGGCEVVLPRGHRLDLYQRLFKNYDRKLPIIAALIEKKYKHISIVDIGANIGDTAALLRGSVSAPIVCVEGNPAFTPLLERNTNGFPGVIRVVKKFVGSVGQGELGTLKLVTDKGTARFNEVDEGGGCGVGFIGYDDICKIKKDLFQTRLVKIDTDGYDFKIILSSIEYISKDDSVLFFEFDPSFLSEKDMSEPLEALGCLLKEGYEHYLIYDNFGNMMIPFSCDHERFFLDLARYLRQCRESGGGVSYFDVCCFKSCDYDLFKEVINLEEVSGC